MNSLSYMPGPRPSHRLDYRGDERAKAIVSEMLGKSDAAVDVLLVSPSNMFDDGLLICSSLTE